MKSGHVQDIDEKKVVEKKDVKLKYMADLLKNNDYSGYDFTKFKNFMEINIPIDTNLNTTHKKHIFRL